jgi:NADPH:quinone reductase-like Zn-dependent oxidoreductase
MRKVVLEAFGPPEVLRCTEVQDPEPPPDGYLVELAAIGLNFAEVVERRGLYRRDQRLPYEIGKEAAGTIVAAGREARGFEVGQQVIVIRFDGGCYAERVTAQPQHLLPIPTHLTLEEAAAFAIAFGTAWYAQEELARVRPGESVLIQAAAGGTGSAAISLAVARGCAPVLGTAGGAEKCAAVQALGASACIDYRSGEFAAQVRERTAGRGIDYCLESVGGEVFERSLESLAPLGRLVLIGFSSIARDHATAVARVHPLKLFQRSWGLFGLNVENLDFPRRREIWRRLCDFAESHRLRPLLGPRFPLAEAAAAHAAVEGRRTAGKVLLIP